MLYTEFRCWRTVLHIASGSLGYAASSCCQILPTPQLAVSVVASQVDPPASIGGGVLSADHIKDWREKGYLVLRANEWLLPHEQKNLAIWMEEVQNWPDKAFHLMKYFEKSAADGSNILNRVENFIPYHKGLNDLFNGSKVLDMMDTIMGGPVLLYKDKINMKLPGGGGFEPHQDILAGWGSYGNGHMNFVTLSVAVDHAHVGNGALECVAGMHKKGKLGEDWKPLDKEVVDDMEWNMVETFPGDVIIFDAFVPHRSSPNLDTHSRRNYYLTYNLASEGDYRTQYFIDKRKNYPPDIEREPGKVYVYKV